MSVFVRARAWNGGGRVDGPGGRGMQFITGNEGNITWTGGLGLFETSDVQVGEGERGGGGMTCRLKRWRG